MQNLLAMDSLGRPTCLFRPQPNNPTIHSQVQIQVFPFIDGYNWVIISSSLAMLLTSSWCRGPCRCRAPSWSAAPWWYPSYCGLRNFFFQIIKSFLLSKSRGRQFLVLVINLERKMGLEGGDRLEAAVKTTLHSFHFIPEPPSCKILAKKTCLQKKICRITELKKWINNENPPMYNLDVTFP